VDDTALDRGIDDVARNMTEAHLPAGFRATVMARVLSAPRPALPFARVAAGVVAATSLVLAVILWRGWPLGKPVSQPQPHVDVATARPVLDQARPAPHTAGPAAGQRHAGPSGSRVQVSTTRVAHAGLAWEAGPEPLPGIDPLMIAAAGPAPLDIQALDIAPIQELDPIVIPAAGSGPPDPERRFQ
jgi:hypothetical protein